MLCIILTINQKDECVSYDGYILHDLYVSPPLQLLLDLLDTTTKQSLRNTLINAIFRILEVVFHRHRKVAPPGEIGNEVKCLSVLR